MAADQKAESSILKVIGAGFGRTGTTSLKVALDMLGFKCYHMQEVFKNPTHPKLWVEAYEGKLTDYDLIFKGEKELEGDPYTATCDWPSTVIWEELIKKYPDAKVILTLRDAEGWYKSMRNTVYRVSTEFPVRYFIPPAFHKTVDMQWKLIWGGTFQNRFEDKNFAIDIYNRHNERVKELVPKEKLLVFDVTKKGESWKELCEFLEVEEPPENTPFPRANDTKEAAGKIRMVNIVGWTVIFIGTSIFIGAVAYLIPFFSSAERGVQ